MGNFKKISAVAVAASLMLSTAAPAFAATSTVNGEKANVLNKLGLYAGTSLTDFVPSLESKLTRGQSAVLLAKIFNMDDAANALSDAETTAILKDFADGAKVSSYAKKRMAYLVKNGVMSGSLDTATGKVYINDKNDVLGGQFATLVLKQLGYEVPDWKKAIEQLSEVPGAKDIADYLSYASTSLLRDHAVGLIYGSLTADYAAAGLETVIDRIVAGNESIRAEAEKAGLIAVPSSAVADSVVAIANNKVAVTLKDAANASAADFAIVKKGTTTKVEVKNVVRESDKVYVVETDALVGGTSYTLTVNGVALNFTGIAADTTAPTIKTLSSVDTNTFDVEFSDKMDFASVTDKANYTFDKDVKVVSATLNSDRTKVTLVTDSAKKNIVYTLTIQNVKNSDGKAIAKTVRTITATEDNTAPKVLTHKVQNNRTIIVDFSDASGMDKAALESVANYSINDLTVESVKAYDAAGDDGKYDQVVITTSTQQANKSYTLTMTNLTDASVRKNALGATTRTFRGAPVDTSAPTVNITKSVQSFNNNTVKIWFSDNNAMDVASLEDVSNYTIKDNTGVTLEIISAKAMASTYPDAYNSEHKGVILTTAQQVVYPTKINYTVEVRGVQDEFGNALKPISGTTYAKYNFTSSNVDEIAPYVTKVEFVNSTTVKLLFNEELKKSVALDPTNYVFDGGLGSAIKAELSSDRKTVTLTTQAQTGNKKYTITMNNLEDDYNNVVANAKATFISTSSVLDVTAPEVEYIYPMNEKEVHITMSEAVKDYPRTIVLGVVGTDGKMTSTTKNFSFSGLLDDGKTVVYKAATAADVLTTANYQIKETSNTEWFIDAAGNKMSRIEVAVGNTSEGYTFSGNTTDNTAPAVDYVEQIDAKTLRVYFTEPVAPTVSGFSKVDSDAKETHFTSLNYSTGNNFKVGSTPVIPVAALADLAGDPIGTNYNEFTAYLEDTVKPVITGVYAEDNKTVYVQYDEKLSTAGSYKIYYLGSSNSQVSVFSGSGTVTEDDNGAPIVKITMPSAVDASRIYYLEPLAGAIDIAGNRADVADVKFDFPGTNRISSSYITGVQINNAKTITVNFTGKVDISSINVFEADSTTSSGIGLQVAASGASTGTSAERIALNVPVLAGQKYKVEVTFADGKTEVYSFTGNTPEIGGNITASVGSVSIDLTGFDSTKYSYEAKLATDLGTAIANDTIVDGNSNNFDNVVTFTQASFTADSVVYLTIIDNASGAVVYTAKVAIPAV